MRRREEHAQRDEKVSQNFRVTRQRISQQDVPKFPILRLRNPADADPLQRRQRPVPPIATDKWYGHEESDYEDQKI